MPLLGKGVFRALEYPTLFIAVCVECGAAMWRGEIDIAPEEPTRTVRLPRSTHRRLSIKAIWSIPSI